jgi:hypothetical protein
VSSTSLLTSSSLKTYRECARKYDLSYRQGFRPVRESEPLRFGTLLHDGLEAWWLAVKQERLDRLTPALEAISGNAQEQLDRIKAQELMIGYETRWARDVGIYEVLAVEARFTAPVLNPETMAASRTWQLSGKVDVIVRRRDTKRVSVVEHKSTSEAIESDSDGYWSKLAIDGQISHYIVGAETLGHEVDECLYDVLKKPAIRLLQATPIESRKFTKAGELYANQRANDETLDEFRARLRADILEKPDWYFQRKTVPRLSSQLEDWLFDTWQLGRQIREGELAGRAARNPDACFRYNSRCPFWECCTAGLIPEEHPDLFRRLSNVHPELAEEKSHAAA